MAVTKQQLVDENTALRNRVAELEAALRCAQKAHRSPPSDPTWEARKAAMEAARAEAIRTGRTVKVQF